MKEKLDYKNKHEHIIELYDEILNLLDELKRHPIFNKAHRMDMVHCLSATINALEFLEGCIDKINLENIDD